MLNSIAGVGTSMTPAATVAPDGKGIFLTWKGEGGDQGLYWTKTQQLAPNPATGKYTFDPAPQRRIIDADGVNIATSHGPALASFAGLVYLAWKGEAGDNAIYWSSFDGTKWTPQTRLAAATNVGPALVATDNGIFLMWKGASDNKIWWAALGDAFDYAQSFAVLGPVKVNNAFFETSATPALASDGHSVYMAWKGASSGNLHWAVCENTQSVVVFDGGLPVTSGISAWGNYQWEDQQSIPAYQTDAAEASIPGVTIDQITGTGAGPTNSGPALTYVKGSYSSGLYIAWVSPALNVDTAEWGPSYPYISFSYKSQGAALWNGGINGSGDSADTTPRLTAIFPAGESAGNVYTPIYFFKGIGDDWTIYYDSYLLMLPEVGGGPRNTVAGGSFPPGWEPSGDASQPVRG